MGPRSGFRSVRTVTIMRILIAAVVVLLVFLGPVAGANDGLRCGTRLVKLGDTKFQVLERCGPPLVREVVSGSDERRVEEWFYRRGQTQFIRVLTFQGTELIRIRALSNF